jgi:hypothetical protein
MQEGFEKRWNQLAQEVLSGMRDWREQHPRATMQEIEEELDKRMARMRAGVLEDLAMASAAAEVGGRQGQEPARCPSCGGPLQARGKQVRTLRTQGDQAVKLRRSYGYCPACQVGFFPLDEELGLRANGGFTPRVEASMVRLATWMPFRRACRELAFFTGVQVWEATVRTLAQRAGRTQVRLQDERRAALLEQRPPSPTGPDLQLMSLDGAYIQLVSGEWKEVKTLALGVVGEPVEERGEQVVHSSELSYFSRMCEAEQFEQAALGEIHERGVETAGQVCAVSDGADWIPKFVDYHRSDAVRILDFAHAMGYVAEAGQAAHEHLPVPAEITTAEEQVKFKQARFRQWLKEQRRELKQGEGSLVLGELERLQALMQASQAESAAQTIAKKLQYLTSRRAMLAYASFAAQGYPIGSGSVESANKLVVQSRMKGAGMRWAPEHVNAMLALRNLACNDRWEQGWLAIGHGWQQERATRRQSRSQARLAASSAVSALLPSACPAEESPPASSRPEPSQPSTPAPVLPRGSRSAGTHPWQQNFLRRRSA